MKDEQIKEALNKRFGVNMGYVDTDSAAFDPVAWCLAYSLVYGKDDFIKLFYLFYTTENMAPLEAACFITNNIYHNQFRRAINEAIAMEKSCRRMGLKEDVRPQGLYYFWQRKREIFMAPDWEP